MSATTPTAQLAVTVEQLFKLVQQNIRLWARPGALSRIYTQASELALRFDQCYNQSPDKLIAQLHLHKPHFDFLTNLTAKAAIFATIEVNELQWQRRSRRSVISAALTANIAILPHLLKQHRGESLSDKQKLTVAKSAQLSYQLLQKNQVLDPLWLHCVLTSSANKVTRHYPVGIYGAIVRNAYRFAKPLCRLQSVGQISVGQILRQVFLADSSMLTAQVVNQAAKRIHNLGSGALVMLNNDNAAMLMHHMPDGGYLAFMFSGQEVCAKGRFVLLKSKHIKASLPLYQCEQPKLYSQLWEAPLNRYVTEKQLELTRFEGTKVDIYTPPRMFQAILENLFEAPNLTKLSHAIDHTTALKALLTQSATQLAAQNIPVKDTKHALAMLGLNRIGPMLTQGVMNDMLQQMRFAGDSYLHCRLQCFVKAAAFYGKYNDLVQPEEQSMYALFYLAPLFFDDKVQTKAHQLYRQFEIDSAYAFCPQMLFNLSDIDNIDAQRRHLLEQWQLPKRALEVMRQLNKFNSEEKQARTVGSIVAVLHLAAFHTHTIYNHLDISNPLLQQRLRDSLAVIGLDINKLMAMQEDFLRHYNPQTPLS